MGNPEKEREEGVGVRRGREGSSVRVFARSLRGGLALVLMFVNVVVWTIPVLLLHGVKLLIPARSWRGFWSRVQNGAGSVWISLNSLNLRLTNPVRWDVEGLESLSTGDWYLVLANHQSWVDILVLQKILNRRAPFLKFLLKKELFWVPFLGLAWWALDYPFLERSSNPARDRTMILRAADKFRVAPVTVMNFVEGTRFTPEKHEKQNSPWTHLLKPRAGGLTFLLTAMGSSFRSILDVTIAYPDGAPTLWRFMCGETREIRVRVRTIPVTGDLLGDFAGDKAFRRHFVSWLNEVWSDKDRELARLLGSAS